MPEGNYSGANLETFIQELLNGLGEHFIYEVVYNPARGVVNIEQTYEGVHANNEFLVPSDFGIMNWMGNTDSGYPWRNIDGTFKAVDINSLHSVNGVSRNTQMSHRHQLSDYFKSYESGFIDSLSDHNIYFHCPNLRHFNSISVRGESTVINKYMYFHHSVTSKMIVLLHPMIKWMSGDN